MNLIEALRTRRLFRRPGHGAWLQMKENCALTYADGSMPSPEFFREDILADDWDVLEEVKGVTRESIRHALADTVQVLEFNKYVDEVCKKLGFTD